MRKQRKALTDSVEGFYASLRTHLPYTWGRNKKGEGTRQFAVETCIEYCERMLKALRALR